MRNISKNFLLASLAVLTYSSLIVEITKNSVDFIDLVLKRLEGTYDSIADVEYH